MLLFIHVDIKSKHISKEPHVYAFVFSTKSLFIGSIGILKADIWTVFPFL